ncbi:MAG TPA: ABC transporter substrate-binding protein [Streptosporangiaceae bacterium]|jgi:NitT/TauT family transport system substrate-binding protein|nr:ABC transporter substrate-binding protein [Streptosporangiaceae bacterium]
MRHVLALANALQGPRLLRPIRPAAVGGAAVLMLAGCSALGGGSNGVSAPSGTTITVAAVPSIGDAPLYLAHRDGLFTQHGLTVTIKEYPSLQAEIDALGNGQADIAAGDYTGFFAAAGSTFAPPSKGGKKQSIQGGTTLRVIGDGYDAANNVMEVLTLPGNNTIKSAADLQGKTVYTPPAQAMAFSKSKTQPYSIETLATQAVLRNDGVSVTTINWHPAKAGSLVQALEDHKANAILVGEPYLFQAQKKGAVAVLDSASGETQDLPLLGYFTTSAYASAHAQSVRAFQAAMTEAQTRAAARGQIQSMFTSAAGVSAQDAPLIALGSYPTFFSVGQVQRVADLMFDAGMLTTPLDVRELALQP